jgi:hypothetical protein
VKKISIFVEDNLIIAGMVKVLLGYTLLPIYLALLGLAF